MNTEFRVFYSGFESKPKLERLISMCEAGLKVDGVLVSYLNLNKNLLPLLKELKNYGVMVMIDSGAHSIIYYWLKKNGEAIEMGHEPSAKAKDIVDNNKFDEYVEGYIDFISKHKDIFDIYVELDVQMIVGYDKVYEWRQKWLDAGLEPMLVWHGEDTDEMKRMLAYSRYIGLGGTGSGSDVEFRRKAAIDFRRMNPDVWLHWFAFTAYNQLGNIVAVGGANSVDSTTWTMASRLGLYYVMQGGKLITLNYKENPLVIRQQMEAVKDDLIKFGIDYEKLYNFEDFIEGDFYNLIMSQMFSEKLKEILKAGKIVSFDSVGEIVNQIKAVYSIEDSIEEVLKYLIDQKLRRYVFARQLEESQGVIDKTVTQLEDSMAVLVEKYLKLKYPERFKTVRVKEERINEVNEAFHWEEKLKQIQKAFAMAEDIDEE